MEDGELAEHGVCSKTKHQNQTATSKVFLDHARAALVQVEATIEATRRAAVPAKASLGLDFLTGYEFDWLPAIIRIMYDELRHVEIVILSPSSPDLVDD
ncbi:hypothetical protein [Rhizobium jaguaris]|uniref:hypothetical protein n=1 Tax=Rhizobium jaguaris TaxID=1312183 RepID=UPI0013C4BB38|nr:hypothetical protein [Rhizobium jaguaris]